jgi:tripartite-type tricarboxylate transporter receptor subunit TctC
VRALALAAPSATPVVAKVPQLEQLGMTGATMTSWVIMIGPRGIPAEITAKLNAAINEAISEPDVRDRLLKAGIETYTPANPAGTGAYLKQEVERYRSYQSELGDRLTK